MTSKLLACQVFFFNIMGHLMMVSERSHHKDVKSENVFEICLSTQKI